MWNKTSITSILRIKYPIILGAFGGRFSSTKLLSIVSNLGGMGSFGLKVFTPKEILGVNHKIKQLTNQPYALNLWVPLKNDPLDHFQSKDFEKLKESFRPHFEKMNIPLPQQPNHHFVKFEDQIEALLEAKPPVASFIFGVPSPEIILELRKRDIKIIATATSLEEILLMEEAEVDIIVASGKEAGGHRPSFLKSSENSLHSTRDLIKEAAHKVRLPLIAAGGITTGKDISEMLKLGASAVQMGTAFLATDESNASAIHKAKLREKQKFKTDLTRVFTGRLARTISNKLSEEFDLSNNQYIAPYPIQSSFMSSLRKAALEQNISDYVAYWSGQPSQPLQHTSAEELFKALVNEAENSFE